MPANRKHTNKTAHVLNVITAGRETADEAPAAASASAPAVSPVVAPLPVVPVVEVEHAPDELSDQIREALREEVERTENEKFSALQPEVIRTGDRAGTDTSGSPAPAPSVQPAPSVGRGAPARPAPPVPVGESQVPPGTDSESEYINVMQALVREKVPKYIKLLGVCSCSRCQADVEALALSHLEPKYIVLQKCQRFPFSVYENHYNAAVTSQIISACRIVMEKPRH